MIEISDLVFFHQVTEIQQCRSDFESPFDEFRCPLPGGTELYVQFGQRLRSFGFRTIGSLCNFGDFFDCHGSERLVFTVDEFRKVRRILPSDRIWIQVLLMMTCFPSVAEVDAECGGFADELVVLVKQQQIAGYRVHGGDTEIVWERIPVETIRQHLKNEMFPWEQFRVFLAELDRAI
jgi:hypothetical protein